MKILFQKRLRRILSLLLVVSLLAATMMLFTSCGSPTYLTVGGVEVPYDMVRCTVKQYMMGYTEAELADEEVRQKIRDDVLLDLQLRYVVYVMAEELDLKLSSDAKKEVKENLKAMQALDDYDEMLEEMYATDDVMQALLEIEALDNLIFDTLTVNGTLKSDNDTVDTDLASGRWYAAEYVILQYDDTNYASRKKALEDAVAAAGSDLKSATAGIAKLYSSEFFYATDGCFTETIYAEDFENTVKALAVGEVSGIVETTTSTGTACLMVIRRVAIDDDYVDNYYNDIVAYYLAREYAELMTEKAEALPIVVEEDYQENDILDIE